MSHQFCPGLVLAVFQVEYQETGSLKTLMSQGRLHEFETPGSELLGASVRTTILGMSVPVVYEPWATLRRSRLVDLASLAWI